MSDPREKFKAILLSTLVGSLMATVGALMSKKTNTREIVKNWIAGIITCIAIGLVLGEFNFSSGIKTTISGLAACSVSSWWPILEEKINTFFRELDIPFLNMFKSKKKDDAKL